MCLYHYPAAVSEPAVARTYNTHVPHHAKTGLKVSLSFHHKSISVQAAIMMLMQPAIVWHDGRDAGMADISVEPLIYWIDIDNLQV